MTAAARPRVAARRRWRRHGRRGQVAAVATILGLMLLVTMIANYLATQLPATMRVNDANHALQVENEVAALDAAIHAATEHAALGGVFTEPITLGSESAPPFAPPDSGVIGPGRAGTGVNDSYKITEGSSTVPIANSGGAGASFVVFLRNSYTPTADIALDQGAVVYAQANGLPLMLVGPSINYTGGTLSLWIPEFDGTIGSEAGVGVAEVALRYDSVERVSLPADGTKLATGSSVTVTVESAFAAAWLTYLENQGFTGMVSCAPATSAVCVGPYSFNGGLGKITLTVPATSLDLVIATYSISLW